nr:MULTISPECIES: hypothetical protein [unclassified Bradyrhizobium]
MPRICGKPKVKCGDCPHHAFLPVTNDVIGGHLRGHHTIGVYPLLTDETCWFLAVDFDKATWMNESAAFLQACSARGIPAALERSRSGQGAHVWIFFAEPVTAAIARRLGAHLITETMERNPDIGFSSYDRFFPSQDSMPAGGSAISSRFPCNMIRARLGTASFSTRRLLSLIPINGLSSRRSGV